MKNYRKTEQISDKERTIIIDLIVHNFHSKQLNMTLQDSYRLEKEIIHFFPQKNGILSDRQASKNLSKKNSYTNYIKIVHSPKYQKQLIHHKKMKMKPFLLT